MSLPELTNDATHPHPHAPPLRHRHRGRMPAFSQDEDSIAAPSPESGRAFSPDTRATEPGVRIGSNSDDDRFRSLVVSEKAMVPVSGRKRQQHPLGADVFSQQHIADELDLDGHLPHIPLRPFRNQVGGHSAIYKFTKRAVCKVSNPLI